MAKTHQHEQEFRESRARYVVPLVVFVAMLLMGLVGGVYRLDLIPGLDRVVRTIPLPMFLGLCVGISAFVFGMLVRFALAREQLIRMLTDLRAQLEEKQETLSHWNVELLGDAGKRAAELEEKVAELERFRIAMVSILEDLTESRDTIEQARAFDDAMFANLDTAVIVYDTKGVITRVNAAAMRLMALPEDAIVGKEPDEVYDIVNDAGEAVPFEARPAARILQAGGKSGGLQARGYNLKRRDGTTIPIDLSASPVIIGGAMRAVVVLATDVTEARRIDRSKSEFVSLASHQLRTPLTAISWYAELLLSDESAGLSADGKEHLREIYLANRRMVDLVDSLLNVSRIELGSFSVDPKPIDLASIIATEADAFKPVVQQKQLTFTVDVQPGMPPYPADTRLMAIILQNLFSNAVRYTLPSGSVHISCVRNDEGVLLTVADTGIGVPANEMDKIFMKMFRASNARIVEGEGSGLGLYLVKSIVDQVGGKITVTSELNKGTTFTVRLPAEGMKARTGTKALVRSSLPQTPAW